MKRYGSRAGWSLVVLAVACVVGVGWVKWRGPLGAGSRSGRARTRAGSRMPLLRTTAASGKKPRN